MAQVNPYLNFTGDCEAAFEFYKSVFGGEFTFVGRYNDMPPAEGMPAMDPADADKIMHVSLPISKETILFGSDICGPYANENVVGNNIHISINVDSEEEGHKVFNGLSEGGKVGQPLEKMFWGALFGMFTDKFGIHWMVNYDYQQK